jgi:hypothetical protein
MEEDKRFISLANLIKRYDTSKFLLLKEFNRHADAPKGISVAGSWVFLLADVEAWEAKRLAQLQPKGA